MNALSVKSLPQAEADLAFPLVQMMRPDVSLSSWRQFVARCAAQAEEAGVTVLTDDAGYIQGIFTWAIRSRLGLGRMLVTEEFGFVYAVDPRPAAELLLRRIEKLGRERHCQAISVCMPHDLERALRTRGGDLGDLLAAGGYRIEGTNYVLALDESQGH